MAATGLKFAAIALRSKTSRLTQQVDVSDGFTIYPGLPYATDSEQFWRESLGTLRFDEIWNANLVFVSTVPAQTIDLFGEDNKDANDKAFEHWYSFLLIGVPHCERINAFTGALRDGRAKLQQVGKIPLFYPCPGTPGLEVDKQTALRETPILNALLDVYAQRGHWKRLKKGFKIFTKGISEKSSYDRVHQFVRSMEALIISVKGGTEKRFIHRCQTFCSASSGARQILKELYVLRSRVEHLEDWDDLFPDVDENGEIQTLQNMARQAEFLARHTYSLILQSPELLNHFKDDKSLEYFWSLKDHERSRFLTKGFDLTKA